MNEIVLGVTDIIILSTLIPLVVFVVRYVLFSPFTVTPEGKNLLFQKLSLISIFIYIATAVVFGPEYPGREWVRLAVFSAVCYFYWVDVVQLWSIQKKYPFKRRRSRS